MTFRGTVKGNVVVLEPGAKLPEGATVHVETDAVPSDGSADFDGALFRMADLAVETGIPDLATNADHYLYGHPKISHAQ
jgi:hypothetical protein